ncbi:MAG: Translation initiation factor IF-2 [Candidatus Daviesbacteria bacterium GW2011_GWA1_41_61]|uniref:Translation initiation factor IF-2 n=1 Tax=Candidatus Daviesbacteria bacterium GW2011_GWA2_40_9 TaxID=1618424 RepID=A0A0G0U7X6_9BACT|nr:MAG: Translation initiation factor IF-2 [Candidatus Daviesbacteria bacterium GW2011_GWC1_40_9]KKR83361.1 MAG: Translation initiation factor IF-2 [Candidatus Daviesbacteria bacterium GW2011_GWA2_40_9]KKR93208.1 MAG: Translation initiation factor IF-2 [Candidatus Daviesbacteria bacterium GW2011_GWB1_41_15]KKS14696.1 MAG: Translation initiation factor IF-2 [Candidatus Daviesbacteria bacterium GW2011_GWA1_41_61]
MTEITRPPVVTILGHVDHGKTTLLDFIRKTSVVLKEHGGITQAIGAYQAQADGKPITFIDTPGHAAFEKMRSRGVRLADIAVLMVAVDDGVMPQTVEAITHIQSANIPMIVAVNKIDLPGVNVQVQLEKIKRQLSDQKVLVEEYGGDVPIVPISAKTGQGVEDLLETINLLAEIHELKGDPEISAVGVIIESRLDKFRGPLATVLVRDGSLQKGDNIKAGETAGKVRGMFDWAGKAVDLAGPSMPVEVLGFVQVPAVGVRLGEDIKKAEETIKQASFLDKLRQSETQVLAVVIRADNQGSLEAIEDVVGKLNEGQQHLKVISSGTGDIIDSDVELAATARAIVLGFNVKVASSAHNIAETNHVLIRTYTIIYELMEELQEVVEGVLQPTATEEIFGRAQIIAQFPYGKGERIAGCQVLEGTISKGPKVRVLRDGQVVEEGKIKSLKKVKEEVSKVEKGQECGMIFDGIPQFQVGDLVESYRPI